MTWSELDWHWNEVARIAMRLGIAWLLSLPLAWEREKASRTAGMRTFPLVSLGACAYLMLGRDVLGGHPDAEARVIQGLMTGIGFVGGGVILKKGLEVHGIATAASLWNTAAIGAAVAYERYALGAVLSVANLFALHLFHPVARHQRPEAPHRD